MPSLARNWIPSRRNGTGEPYAARRPLASQLCVGGTANLYLLFGPVPVAASHSAVSGSPSLEYSQDSLISAVQSYMLMPFHAMQSMT